MTRKDALHIAIETLKKSDIEPEILESAMEKLELCLSELPFSRWSEDAIFDACDQFVAEHGRITIKDFDDSRDLPSHTVIKNRFGMTAREFRNLYYPLPEAKEAFQKKRLQILKKELRQEIISKKLYTTKKYATERDKRFPCMMTLEKWFGVNKWDDILAVLNIETPVLPPYRPPLNSTFSMKCDQYNTY